MPPLFSKTLLFFAFAAFAFAQPVTTTGFNNAFRPEAPGTLLSHPANNDSEATGRTTTLNYLNGWLIVGAESPGSREGSDLQMRVYDISNPANPIRRFPADFGHSYPDNSWHFGNAGWNAHGSAQAGSYMLPEVMRVQSFGGIVERGAWNIPNGVPDIGAFPVGWNRSAQAGPWLASFPWYGSPDEDFTVQRIWQGPGGNTYQTLATWDHVGPYGGGDWHPMFFGDLLIYARHGASAQDGVVVYRLQYNNFDDPASRSITPQYVGSLSGGFQGYWPNLFSDGTGLYVIGSATNILMGADITAAADPAGDGSVNVAASLTIPGFTNASYPVYQDQFGFIHNRKVNMTSFLAGDANPIALTLQEGAPNFADTSQMSLPLGNLWVTGGYPHGFGTANYQRQGMSVWVHQQEPDSTPPRVTYHIPQANRTNYPRHAPLSFLLHEHPRHGGPRNGIDFTVRPVGAGDVPGAFVPGFLIHDFSGNLTFTPDAPLAADTTYQVDFHSDETNQIGFADAAGNYIEPYSFRFSTGGGISATAPPVITSVTASNAIPAPDDAITVTVAATGDAPLEYRFNFDGVWSAWGAAASAGHTYTAQGRPRVLVQVRDSHGSVVTGSVRLLVIEPLPPGPRPTQSSTLAVGDFNAERHVWVVNPDANTVTVLNAVTGAFIAEHAVGADPRGIARDANGRYWITCHDSDEIRVLNADGSTHATLPLAYGAAPFGVVASPDGQWIYVSLYGSSQLQRYSAANPPATPLTQATVPTPRALAVTADGARVLVTRFISPDLHGQVAAHHGATLAWGNVIGLGVSISWDNGDRSGGTPNYLSGIAISPDGSRAAVVSKQDNTQRGLRFGVGDLTHETTVRAVISFIDLNTNQEIANTRRDFDNSESPSAVAWSPLGDTILVTLQGNNRLVGLDALNLAPVPGGNSALSVETSPAVIALDLGTGLAPQGLLLDAVSQRLFAQNFMGRSVTVRDAQPFLGQNLTTFPLLATTATTGAELLTPQVLLGKQIFYNAADPRMSADSYISCASCHIDGGHDGRAWDFTGRGEGLRRTTDLRGRSGTGHGNVHWSGNFDEIQDFEHDIRGPFGGTGFLNLTPQQFATLHPTPASGKIGLSPELDALAAYVASLNHAHTPRSPQRQSGGTLTASALAGRTVFQAQNCASCHSGSEFTNSAPGSVIGHVLSNVGTQSLLSGGRLGGTLSGVDVPTLHGLHATHLYLHHGEAKTLPEVFSYSGGALLLAANAELLPAAGAPGSIGSLQAWQFNPAQGGGGFTRGMFGGNTVGIAYTAGAAEQARVRFNNVNGGSGGMARIAVRYLRQYGNTSALLRVNGVDQTFTLLPQTPDFGWHMGGWRWHVAEALLNAGAANTIEVSAGLPVDNQFSLNAILVTTANDLAAAQPHRLVQDLPETDRNNLLAYLRQLDGRDDNGTPLPAPLPPAPQPPVIVAEPQDVTLAAGNTLNFHVVTAGTGPFTFEWRRGSTLVGTNSPFLEILNVQPGDAGLYTVTITNAVDTAVSTPAEVAVNSALGITTTTLPQGTAGQVYHAALAATGGVGDRVWTLQSGVLPAGLSLSAAGVISGTPAVAARAALVLRVTDSSGSDTRALALDVQPVGGFVSDPDLVLHYTFDEGGGTQIWDISPAGNNHSTNVPAAHWNGGGRFGGAYGPAAADAGINNFLPANQADLDFDPRGDEYTISAWVRTTALSSYHIIAGKDGGDPYRVQLRLWTVSPPNLLQGINGNQYGGTLNGAPPVNDGQWHLVTLVNYNDSGTWRTRLYYDDGTQFTQFDTGAGGTVPAPLRIGGMSAGWNGWAGQLDDFRIYRRALSQGEVAQLYSPPVGPTVSITLAPGQMADGARPYAEFDAAFSEPVTGLTVEDFTHSGTHALLMTLAEGTHYRLRIAGYASGVVSAQLLAARVSAVSDGEPNNASNIAAITYSPPVADDLAPLSDEFENAATLADWQRNYIVEGWTDADKLEVWDIDTSRSGHMRLIPYASSWYQPYTGAYAFKNVTGDFVATMRMHAARRNGLPGRPTSTYSLGGIMVRTPRGFSNAAPNPDPGTGVVLPWPPSGYTTPWTPNSENYIFLSYGYTDAAMWGNVPNTWYNEVKTTINGVSTLYATQSGIPANTDLVTLQVVRSGNVFVVLRRHGEGGPWIIENRFTRNDMPATLQLGITTYTDWASAAAQDPFHHNRTVNTGGNPDLVADADYFRLRRPAAAITPAALQSLPVTGPGGTLVQLTGTALAAALGDSVNEAHQPAETFDDWLAANLTPAQLIRAESTDPQGDANGNGLPNLLEFALGSDDIAPLSLQIIGGTVELTLTRNSAARGVTFIVEQTHDFTTWTPLATSIDGAQPSGTATISEGTENVRVMRVESPAPGLPTFYRVRVLMN
jgi:hypothetical protein